MQEVLVVLEQAYRNLDEFKHSNFKFDQTQVWLFVLMANLNLIKLEIREIFRTKLGKLVSKLELELKKWKKLELNMCSNSKFWSSMKLKFDEKWACSTTKF